GARRCRSPERGHQACASPYCPGDAVTGRAAPPCRTPARSLARGIPLTEGASQPWRGGMVRCAFN
ncbi:MAG TPA: hypothetical protein VGI05_22590, partial [Streptosporangiaceae bacterium]